MGEREENLEKIASVIEKHGLGIVSFIVLMFFLGNQIYTSQKFTDKFFELEKLKIEQNAVTNERLTSIEGVLKKLSDGGRLK